jgi:hypothetical protein
VPQAVKPTQLQQRVQKRGTRSARQWQEMELATEHNYDPVWDSFWEIPLKIIGLMPPIGSILVQLTGGTISRNAAPFCLGHRIWIPRNGKSPYGWGSPTPSGAPHPKEHAPDTNRSEQWRLGLRRQAPPAALGRPSRASQARDGDVPVAASSSTTHLAGARFLHISVPSQVPALDPRRPPSLPPIILHSESSDHIDCVLTVVLAVDSSVGPVFL